MPVRRLVLARFDGPVPIGDQQLQTLCEIAHLALGGKDQAATGCEVGAGPVHAEEARVARRGDAQIRRRPPADRSLRISPPRPEKVIGHSTLLARKPVAYTM